MLTLVLYDNVTGVRSRLLLSLSLELERLYILRIDRKATKSAAAD